MAECMFSMLFLHVCVVFKDGWHELINRRLRSVALCPVAIMRGWLCDEAQCLGWSVYWISVGHKGLVMLYLVRTHHVLLSFSSSLVYPISLILPLLSLLIGRSAGTSSILRSTNAAVWPFSKRTAVCKPVSILTERRKGGLNFVQLS